MTKEERWIKESIENFIFVYTGKPAKISDADAQRFTASVMSYLNLCTPSLPANLDEAAEKAYKEYDLKTAVKPKEHPVGFLFFDGFKAGAEWVAGQGVTFEAKATRKYERSLSGFVSYLVGDEAGAIHKLINQGEEADVIVQIRKKQ